ncbi:MAG: dicarboxylate/amino acid:cation symporter [Planctomycetota bacterium]|jgi:DAACS family dicarboxylate/amino acid:cation (Na+ or H+) symporter
MRIWRWPLHWQILVMLLVGGVLGWGIGAAGGAGYEARWDYQLCELLGDLFMNGLRMLVVPLVVSALITAMAGIGHRAGFARLGGKTLAYYLSTSAVAILTGLLLVNLLTPGTSSDGVGILEGRDTTAFAAEVGAIQAKTAGKEVGDFLDVFRTLIPSNVVGAAASGNMLGLISFSLLFGFFLSRLQGRSGDALRAGVEGVYEITLAITDLVLRFAPLGVFGLLATTVAENYAALAGDDRLGDLVGGIVMFTVTVVAALMVHACVTMPLILMVVAKVRQPWRHYKAMAPALVTAFSSASSSATLPLTLECVEERAGVSNRVASFTLPLGATVNMDGTALYECVAAMFVAQAYGITLGFAEQGLMVAVALLTSIGVAGVPSASLVAIVIILQQVGVPMEGLGVIMVVDRLLDMCRTSVNVFSDSCAAVVVARTEGEVDVLTDRATTPTVPTSETQAIPTSMETRPDDD